MKSRFRGYHDDLSAEADLSGVVDSLGLFELVEFVEESFEVQIPMAEFRPARFSSINNILTMVGELRARQPGTR